MKIRKNGWASFVKFFVILALIFGLVISIGFGVFVALGYAHLTPEYDLYIGIGIALFGALISVASVSMIMAYLTMIEDVRDVRNMMLEKKAAETDA